MTETNQIGLPLLQASQAQKHVTVNEALMRLDGLLPAVLQSISLGVPPAVVLDGMCYAVPAGAVNDWGGHDGEIAIAMNGGWTFAQPARGWRAFVVDQGVNALHDGTGWRAGRMSLSPGNAGLSLLVTEIDHVLAPGPVSTTAFVIPSNALVIGATARVVSDISGTLASWLLGNPGAVGRYGSGLGLSAGSFARGLLGAPMAFYAPEAMQLDATGGDFAGGTVRIAVHYMTLALPDL